MIKHTPIPDAELDEMEENIKMFDRWDWCGHEHEIITDDAPRLIAEVRALRGAIREALDHEIDPYTHAMDVLEAALPAPGERKE